MHRGTIRARPGLMAWLGTAALATCIGALAPSAASAAAFAYIVDMNGHFGVVNLGNGKFTQCGNFGFTPAGLATDNLTGNLYTAVWHNSGFYQVNPANGAVTLIGTASISFRDLGSTTKGLFGTDYNGNLYAIDKSTGATTLIGASEQLNGSTSLSTGTAKLYLETSQQLYLVNPNNAKSKLLGGTSSYFGGMVDVKNVLYGGDLSEPPNIWTIDPKTGASTEIAQINDTSFDQLWGAAPAPNGTKQACPAAR